MWPMSVASLDIALCFVMYWASYKYVFPVVLCVYVLVCCNVMYQYWVIHIRTVQCSGHCTSWYLHMVSEVRSLTDYGYWIHFAISFSLRVWLLQARWMAQVEKEIWTVQECIGTLHWAGDPSNRHTALLPRGRSRQHPRLYKHYITAKERKQYWLTNSTPTSECDETILERACLNRMSQEGEWAKQYVTKLYHLIEFCEYRDLKEEMCLVVGICDAALSDKLQTQAALMLEKAKTLIR